MAPHGSIAQAAQNLNRSYKKAWRLVASLNAQAQTPLVSTQTGGRKGGGTLLTPAGHHVVTAFRGIQQRLTPFLAAETDRLSS